MRFQDIRKMCPNCESKGNDVELYGLGQKRFCGTCNKEYILSIEIKCKEINNNERIK